MAARQPLEILLDDAGRLRDSGHGRLISYSRKVFIPLTHLCRDVCRYCTFAHPPREGEAAYLSPDQVLAIARTGAKAGCKEALFTLGDKPELRYRAAREALDGLGFETTISYLADMCRLVFEETGLLPHANPGVMNAAELAALREVTVSQGIMLESTSSRLCEPGGPHHGSPDKDPAIRLATIEEAGRQRIPFTTGILIGIGETREERLDALLSLRALHRTYGHIQEIIIQNFRAKPATQMEGAAEPDLEDLLWTIAIARLTFGPNMNIQAPPNLSRSDYPKLIAAGLNDWGGISPVTPDHVNPEAPWPAIDSLRANTEAAGKQLVERLAVYPEFAQNSEQWQDSTIAPAILRAIDSDGLARTEDWAPGLDLPIPMIAPPTERTDPAITKLLDRASAGSALSETDIVQLFHARGADFDAVCRSADALRRSIVGDRITYAVNRNINYTNICTYGCRFCAFSKGPRRESLGGVPYLLDLPEIARRAAEAWDRGGTEVCMQGGIHPSFTGDTYVAICEAVKQAAPDIHIHAFSPLEVSQGAATLGISVPAFLDRLRAAGLGSLPGTAAEILDDDVRAVLCPDKLSTAEWLSVIESAHEAGFKTTATIMFGHMDSPASWARHLIAIRDLQKRTGGFTEFVPLPFVHMEAPLYRKGQARRGPTFRETVLMHAVARLALHPHITNIQTSWVKLGAAGAKACLEAGANDLGGSLMNESITRAAGTEHGQEFAPTAMEQAIRDLGREPWHRTTLYGDASAERRLAARNAPPLVDLLITRVPAKTGMRTAPAVA
ncbi:MAG: 5-amino-6-(D-ribitylamino)uracil--L-tyrosine 4-hydroxyphenyl transferase CofH [Proteobacteria bacterium]|nr:5-amino-6-(D-ribitylamino)uracil--L-tyrosine 4-hydroxyphenyl transferase CofH [Pseudomonadota bacterium]